MVPMSDLELLGYRIQELKESLERLTYMHGVMLQALKDISRQDTVYNEKSLARACLAKLELT